MKNYRYLLFDADNTVFDFTRAEYLAFMDTCSLCALVCRNGETLTWSEPLYRQYAVINDDLWKGFERGEVTLDFLKIERFRRLLVENGAPDDALTLENAVRLRDMYMEKLGEQTCLVDGAEEICRKLAARYPLYLITNGISRTQRARFDQSALKPYFKGLFISEEIGVSKPHPAYFDHVLHEIGCGDKSAYLVIGDSLSSDCAGAVGYGLDICYFNPQNKPAGALPLTYTIRRLAELEDILL